MKQRTLKESFSVEGKGLHTGLISKATFNPAPENHGIKFQRIDLEVSRLSMLLLRMSLKPSVAQ